MEEANSLKEDSLAGSSATAQSSKLKFQVSFVRFTDKTDRDTARNDDWISFIHIFYPVPTSQPQSL
jgi:hypothetical protein